MTATVLATIVTAVATAFIAFFSYQSWCILHRQEENDRKKLQPMLIFVNERSEDGTQKLFVKNIGYGPAIDIVFDIPQTGEEMQPYHGAAPYKGPVLLGSLGPEDKIQTPATSRSEVPITENLRLMAVLEYVDILGNCYEIRYEQRQHSKPAQLAQRKIPLDRVQQI